MSRRMAVIGTALAVLLIALAGAAASASSSEATGAVVARSDSTISTSTGGGEVLFVGATDCDLAFAFRGFTPGTQAVVQVSWRGTSQSFHFTLAGPDSRRVVDVTSVLGLGGHRQVQYRASARGALMSATGTAKVHCSCEMGGGEGGGGSGGGSGSGGGTTSGGAAGTAGPAQPIDAQPSFTG